MHRPSVILKPSINSLRLPMLYLRAHRLRQSHLSSRKRLTKSQSKSYNKSFNRNNNKLKIQNWHSRPRLTSFWNVCKKTKVSSRAWGLIWWNRSEKTNWFDTSCRMSSRNSFKPVHPAYRSSKNSESVRMRLSSFKSCTSGKRRSLTRNATNSKSRWTKCDRTNRSLRLRSKRWVLRSEQSCVNS